MHSLREPPAIAEFALARILLFIRRNAAADETGWEVWLSHPAPTDLAEHRRVLRLPLRFSAPENALVMPTSSLAAPMRHADVALAKSFAVRAKEMMAARAETADDVTHRVRRLVARQIASGTPSMAAVARQVGASVSTLRRRLSAEGTTFRRVTEDVRREVAEQELARGSSSCGEVASKLGFANVAAFHRAFRRWTGLAPSDYRRRHRI
jgi:AraC-like DNA-binding protein